jgi:hypothetical protein
MVVIGPHESMKKMQWLFIPPVVHWNMARIKRNYIGAGEERMGIGQRLWMKEFSRGVVFLQFLQLSYAATRRLIRVQLGEE